MARIFSLTEGDRFDVLYDEPVRGKPCVERNIKKTRLSVLPTSPRGEISLDEEMFFWNDFSDDAQTLMKGGGDGGDGAEFDGLQSMMSFGDIDGFEGSNLSGGSSRVGLGAGAVGAAGGRSYSADQMSSGSTLRYLLALHEEDEDINSHQIDLSLDRVIQLYDSFSSDQGKPFLVQRSCLLGLDGHHSGIRLIPMVSNARSLRCYLSLSFQFSG